MTRQKHVICSREGKAIEEGSVRSNRLWKLKAFAETPAKNITRYHQLVTTHVWLTCNLIRIHVYQFHDPIRIRTTRGRHQVSNRLTADLQRLLQDFRRK